MYIYMYRYTLICTTICVRRVSRSMVRTMLLEITRTHTALVPVRCKCIPHYRGTSLIRNAHPHRITVAVKPSLDA